jgi:hypothetical protein
MPRFTYDYELDRTLTADEEARLTAMCQGTIAQMEWEHTQPAHICEQKHAGKLLEVPDENEDGTPVLVAGRPTVTLVHEFLPLCHDCGRQLIRPAGTDATAWVCPAVHRHPLRATDTDTAVECGR